MVIVCFEFFPLCSCQSSLFLHICVSTIFTSTFIAVATNYLYNNTPQYRLYNTLFSDYNTKLRPRYHPEDPVEVGLEFELNTVSGLVRARRVSVEEVRHQFEEAKIILMTCDSGNADSHVFFQDEVNQVMTTVGFVVAVMLDIIMHVLF